MDDKLKRINIFNAHTADGAPCEIQEYESDSDLIRWRIYAGFPGCPWLRKTGDNVFIDDKTGTTFTISPVQ